MNHIKNIPASIRIDSLKQLIRVERVLLDTDPEKIYGITTLVLHEAVKQKSNRFPRLLNSGGQPLNNF